MAILDCFFRFLCSLFWVLFSSTKSPRGSVHSVHRTVCNMESGSPWRPGALLMTSWEHPIMSAEWPSCFGKDIARLIPKSEHLLRKTPLLLWELQTLFTFLQCWGRCDTWVPMPASTAFPRDLKRRGKRKIISFSRRFCKGHSFVSFLLPLKVWIDVGENLQYVFLRQGLIMKSWLAWNSLWGPGWPQTHGAICLGLPSAGIKSVCRVKLAGMFPRCAVGQTNSSLSWLSKWSWEKF